MSENELPFKGKWFYCKLCDQIAVHFDCCGNSSCNGGGCDTCRPLNKIVDQMYADGTLPKMEDVPHTHEQVVKFFEDIRRAQGWTEEQLEEGRKKQIEMDKIFDFGYEQKEE